jgi:8-oxo-dGTP diphosphatase
MDYVVGFAFDGALRYYSHVLLIQKNKPDWQRGKYNGVGGKIDHEAPDLPSGVRRLETPIEAMVREFFEETGVRTRQEDWELFAVMHDGAYRHQVFCFESQAAYAYDEARTMEVERVVRVPVRAIMDPDVPFIHNVRTIIPLALNRESWRRPIELVYGDGHFAGEPLDQALKSDPTIDPTYPQP